MEKELIDFQLFSYMIGKEKCVAMDEHKNNAFIKGLNKALKIADSMKREEIFERKASAVKGGIP